MSEAFRCAECGSDVALDVAPGGLCPACLLMSALSPDDIPASAGGSLGPYRIIQTLGQGGMGVVYLAEQQEPIRRRVAIKVIKVGFDTREVISRFETERRALALMDHPYVARVLDAGASAGGRPFFVMEYVDGLPITDFCDLHRFSIDRRLDLFCEVCLAVQHAHQRGIVHRDLKSSNVLVMMQDGRAIPKVIDFGIAKAIEPDLLQHTLLTGEGRLLGTPEYMTPEQVSLGPAAIDTRTDIYSLGVLLYELLVGALPFDPAKLRGAGPEEMRRIIREVEAVKPSARIGMLESKGAEAARRRQTSAAVLQKRLLGDLDWITLKALEKDPARRYASASELAADLSRHLHDEPVLAGPPSSVYRARKFVRKYRHGVAIGSIALAALVSTAAVSTVMFLTAESARLEAERRSYSSNILAADLSLTTGEIREAKRRLELCPPSLRGWEWRHLQLDADSSLAVLRAPLGADGRSEVRNFDDIISTPRHTFALGTRVSSSSHADALLEIGTAGSSPLSLTLAADALDPSVSVLAVSADGGRLLTTRWHAQRPTVRTLSGMLTPGVSLNLVEVRGLNTNLADDERRRVFVIDAQSGRILATLPIDTAGLWRGLARDATALSVRGPDPLGRVGLIVDGDLRQPIATVSYPVAVRGALSANGTRAAAWSWDNIIHVWDVESKREIATLEGHSEFIARALFTADAAQLISASADGTIRVWNLGADRNITRIGPLQAPAVALSTGAGSLVAAALADRTIRLWRDGNPIPGILRGHQEPITSLAFDRDGKRLVSTSEDRTVRMWDTAGMFETLTLRGHEDAVTGAAFMEDGRHLVSTSLDGTVRIWNAEAPRATVSEAGLPLNGIGFIDDGSNLVSAHGDDMIRVWDLTTGQVRRQTRVPGYITSLAMSADTRRVAIGLLNRDTRMRGRASGIAALVLDSRNLQTLVTLKGENTNVQTLAFSADGRKLMTGSDHEHVVQMWDVSSGTEDSRWTTDAPARSLAVAANGSQIAIGFANSLIAPTAGAAAFHPPSMPGQMSTGLIVWPLRADPSIRRTPLMTEKNIEAVTAVAYTPDGTRLISGNTNGDVDIWNVRTGRSLGVLSGHEGAVQAIAVSPDGARIASGGLDRTVRIWSLESQEQLLTMRVLTQVQALTFSADGRRLAAGLLGGTIRIWYAR